MFATLYGQRPDTKPTETYFERAANGIWHLRNPDLPEGEIKDVFERLNLKCVQMLFESADQFWDTLEKSDFNIIHAGLDPEALCGKDAFTQFQKESTAPNVERLIYYYSVRHYNHVAQNILDHILISLGDVYAFLSDENLLEDVSLADQAYGNTENYRSTVSPKGHRIWASANFCIEKTVSLLDFTTKYVFELASVRPQSIPRKPKAANVTFGKWKDIKAVKGTPLAKWSDDLRLIHALRDETVHNGTIDHYSKVYEHVVGASVKRRFLLLPDNVDGKLHTAGGRKRFYRQDNHLNARLPALLVSVLNDMAKSLDEFDQTLPDQWDDPSKYFDRHSEFTAALQRAEDTGGFLKFRHSTPSRKQ